MLRWQVAAKGVLQKHISATICISQVYRFPVSDGHLRRRIPQNTPYMLSEAHRQDKHAFAGEPKWANTVHLR